VPQEILDALPPDPEIEELKRERAKYRKEYGTFSRAPLEIHRECEQIYRQIDSLEKQRDRAIKIEYRQDYFYRIHNEELERQLSKTAVIEYVESVIHHQLPERTRLQEVICDMSKDLGPSDIVDRLVLSIDSFVALSHRKEDPRRNRSNRAYSESPDEQPLPEDPFQLVCQSTQCIICMGDDRCTYAYRTHTFSTVHKMMNHVDNHLKDVSPNQRLPCRHPRC